MLGFIDDDYTLDGYIAATPITANGQRMWDALEFTFRVATRAEWLYHDAEVNATRRDEDRNPELAVKAEFLSCEFAAKHLKTWTMKNRGNHAVVINGPNLLKVHHLLFQKLYYIIRGDLMSDSLPNQKEAVPTHEEQSKN